MFFFSSNKKVIVFYGCLFIVYITLNMLHVDNDDNNNEVLILYFWGWIQIIDRLVKICHMYYFLQFYSN